MTRITIVATLAFWAGATLVLSFLIHLAVIDSPPLQLQYVSTRYNLTFAEATTILTIRSVANIALLFLVLPFVAKLLTTKWVDSWFSHASGIIISTAWGRE